MQDRKRETADALQNVGGGLVPEKTSDYSYLYYYSTLRGSTQGQKIERKARFYGLVWNINKPTIDELSSEGIT